MPRVCTHGGWGCPTVVHVPPRGWVGLHQGRGPPHGWAPRPPVTPLPVAGRALVAVRGRVVPVTLLVRVVAPTTTPIPIGPSRPVLPPVLAALLPTTTLTVVPALLLPPVWCSRRRARVHGHRPPHPVCLCAWPHGVGRGVGWHHHHAPWPHLAHLHLPTTTTSITGWGRNHHAATHTRTHHRWSRRWVSRRAVHHGCHHLHAAVRPHCHLRGDHAWRQHHAAHRRLGRLWTSPHVLSALRVAWALGRGATTWRGLWAGPVALLRPA